MTQPNTQVQAGHAGDLVASWLFDEVTGSIAGDDAHGDPTLDGELSDGIDGNGLIFAGTDGFVEVPDADSLDIIGDLTLEAWVKRDTTGSEMGIVGKWDRPVDAGPDNSYVLFFVPDDTLAFCISKDGKDLLMCATTTGTFTDTTSFHHIAATYDASGPTMAIFFDGSSEDVDIDGSEMSIFAGAATVVLGARDGPLDFMDGVIDEVRISNVVRVIPASPTAPLATDGSTKAHWHMDDSVGTVTADASGNGNLGTFLGTVGAVDWNGPTWGSLVFDGVDDYVRVPNDATLEPASVTVSAWVKRDGIPGTNEYILSKSFTSGRASYALYPDAGGSTGLVFYVSDGATFYQSPKVDGATIWDDVWHHVAGVFDTSTNTVRLYVTEPK